MAIDYNQMAQAYADAYRKRVADEQSRMANQLATSKQSMNATYDSNAAQAYINKARQENSLNEQLQARGINGGASETALTRIMNNYALGKSNNEASRAAAIGQLQNTYDTNVANMNSEMERAILENNQLMAQKQAEYEQQQNAQLLEQYSATLERFTSTKAVDKEISRLDPSDPNYQQKLWLLQLRKAQLKGSGSGGGKSGKSSKSYGSSGGSGGGGGGGATPNISANIAAAQAKGQSMTDYYKNANKGKAKAKVPSHGMMQ